jgi:hypothetical protein
MQEKGKDFEKLFLEAVDEGLKVLGESGKHMVFFHLERSYSIKRHDIPKKPEALAAGLEKIFGAGASVLLKLVLESLYSKLGLKLEDKGDYTFAECVNHAKNVKEAMEAKEGNKSPSQSNPYPNPQPELKSLQELGLPLIEGTRRDDLLPLELFAKALELSEKRFLCAGKMYRLCYKPHDRTYVERFKLRKTDIAFSHLEGTHDDNSRASNYPYTRTGNHQKENETHSFSVNI